MVIAFFEIFDFDVVNAHSIYILNQPYLNNKMRLSLLHASMKFATIAENMNNPRYFSAIFVNFTPHEVTKKTFYGLY